MAKGKPIGECSLKSTSLTITPGPARSVITQGNCEGTATGLGTVLGTGTFVGGKAGPGVGVRKRIWTTAMKSQQAVPAPMRVAANTAGAR